MIIALICRSLAGKIIIWVSKWLGLRILPAFVDYDDDMVPEPFGAVAEKHQVFIREKYRNDRGLLEHELIHVRQYWENKGHMDRYQTDAQYRLECELEAYAEQLKYSPGNTDWFAGFIAERYNLNITKEEARTLLEQKSNG